MNNYLPVSYTHLDVYKRQPNTLVDAETYAVLEKEFGANRAAGNARESIRERISLKQTTITLEAVSYTHLDVYKRQG